MKSSTKRNAIRWLHIGVGAIIATYIYSPWGENQIFQMATKAVVIPLTILSGLWLWKGHLLKRFFNKKSSTGISVILLMGVSFIALSFKPANNPTLTLKISGVSNSGTLYVSFCTKEGEWSANGKYRYKFTSLTKGLNTFTISDIPVGIYAVAIFQDNNGNGKLDENLFGTPKEPFAFSNNIIPKFSKPTFEECKFKLVENNQILSIKILN